MLSCIAFLSITVLTGFNEAAERRLKMFTSALDPAPNFGLFRDGGGTDSTHDNGSESPPGFEEGGQDDIISGATTNPPRGSDPSGGTDADNERRPVEDQSTPPAATPGSDPLSDPLPDKPPVEESK